jgi:low molecular weight phosphotyrosine protein phosphatase
MAEGVFRSIVSKPPYKGHINVVDSAGTAGYHTDSPPDSRTMAILKANGIIDYVHGARQVC